MKILIAGASGFIGTQLSSHFQKAGWEVTSLTLNPTSLDDTRLLWNPAKNTLDPKALRNVDVVINLAGANISEKRWTPSVKEAILQSRLQATRTLGTAFASCSHPPKLYIQASAYGFYGDMQDHLCDETTPQGEGFLASVSAQWELAVNPIQRQGIRTIIFRFGLVLSPKGGMLAKILPLFRLGLGGRLGSGTQYMSWIALDDLLSAFSFAISHKTLSGIYNLTAPHSVTNDVFTRILSQTLHRPALLPVPAFALRLFLGSEMANELLLSSTRTDSSRLQSLGYKFRYPYIEEALQHLLH